MESTPSQFASDCTPLNDVTSSTSSEQPQQKLPHVPTVDAPQSSEQCEQQEGQLEKDSQDEMAEEKKRIQKELRKKKCEMYDSRKIEIDFKMMLEEEKECMNRLSVDANDVEALVKLGFIQIRYYKNKTEAMSLFLRVLAIDENDLDGLLGKCYCILEDKKKNEFDLCQGILDTCLAQKIKYWRIYYYQSMLYYLRYKDYLSKKALNKALKYKPNHYLCVSLLALISSEIGSDLIRAKGMIDNLIADEDQFNHDFSVFYRAGKIYEKLRLPNEAIAFFHKSAQYRLNYSQAMKMVSFIYMTQLESINEAEKYALKAIEMDPMNDEAYMNFGEVLETKNQREEAIKQFLKAIEINPHNETAYMLILDQYEHMEDKRDEFHAVCEKFVKYNPTSADANFEMAFSHSIKNNLYEAVRYYKKSLKKEIVVDSYNNLGNVYFQLQDLEEAEQHFTKALHYDPRDESFNDNLNFILLQTGDMIANFLLQQGQQHNGFFDDMD